MNEEEDGGAAAADPFAIPGAANVAGNMELDPVDMLVGSPAMLVQQDAAPPGSAPQQLSVPPLLQGVPGTTAPVAAPPTTGTAPPVDGLSPSGASPSAEPVSHQPNPTATQPPQQQQPTPNLTQQAISTWMQQQQPTHTQQAQAAAHAAAFAIQVR